MKVRSKKCVVCSKAFKPFKTTQRVCSNLCAIKWAKDKQEAQEKGLKNFKDGLNHSKTLKKLMESTTKKVHKYIRDRDKGKPCASCDAPWTPDFQAGHYFNKKQFNGIRFDLNNIHGQCPKCNLYEEGNYAEYSIRLRARIGEEEFGKLLARANKSKRFPHTWTIHELREIQKNINLIQ